ncbi:hypothetical protein B0H19DRAFT_1322189 [Mycena capillaripes]|nr:hypothetical protein B0H19DRAFT_1322081 [Mycena capillaripes]KAJ6586183.1 hypothetical protein B0H19DRAFT_1322189 [Mycena capillaripes]
MGREAPGAAGPVGALRGSRAARTMEMLYAGPTMAPVDIEWECAIVEMRYARRHGSDGGELEERGVRTQLKAVLCERKSGPEGDANSAGTVETLTSPSSRRPPQRLILRRTLDSDLRQVIRGDDSGVWHARLSEDAVWDMDVVREDVIGRRSPKPVVWSVALCRSPSCWILIRIGPLLPLYLLRHPFKYPSPIMTHPIIHLFAKVDQVPERPACRVLFLACTSRKSDIYS